MTGLTIREPCGSLTAMATLRTKRVLLFFGAAVLLFALFWAKGRTAMADFEVNAKAAQRLLAGETLYRTQDSHWQFKYSPFSALLYAPLSFLPLTAAKGVWFFVVAAAIASLIVLSVRLLGAGGAPPGAWAIGLASAVFAKFFLRELQLGQINAVLTAVLLAMALRLERSRDRRTAGPELGAGLLWGLATALKPYAVIFFPYFVLRKRFRALFSGLAVVAVSLAVPAFFYGFRGLGAVLGEWAGTLSKSTPGLFDTQDNVSLMGLLVKWTGDIPLSTVLLAAATILLAALTLAAVLRGNRINDPLPSESVLLMLFIPLLSPLGWDYTFLSAFPAVLLLFRSWREFPRTFRLILAANSAMIGIALYDLMGRRLYSAFMAASVPTLNFLIVAAALFYLRFRKAA
jgi:alpha-1,2-mannosyltransferase